MKSKLLLLILTILTIHNDTHAHVLKQHNQSVGPLCADLLSTKQIFSYINGSSPLGLLTENPAAFYDAHLVHAKINGKETTEGFDFPMTENYGFNEILDVMISDLEQYEAKIIELVNRGPSAFEIEARSRKSKIEFFYQVLNDCKKAKNSELWYFSALDLSMRVSLILDRSVEDPSHTYSVDIFWKKFLPTWKALSPEILIVPVAQDKLDDFLAISVNTRRIPIYVAGYVRKPTLDQGKYRSVFDFSKHDHAHALKMAYSDLFYFIDRTKISESRRQKIINLTPPLDPILDGWKKNTNWREVSLASRDVWTKRFIQFLTQFDIDLQSAIKVLAWEVHHEMASGFDPVEVMYLFKTSTFNSFPQNGLETYWIKQGKSPQQAQQLANDLISQYIEFWRKQIPSTHISGFMY